MSSLGAEIRRALTLQHLQLTKSLCRLAACAAERPNITQVYIKHLLGKHLLKSHRYLGLRQEQSRRSTKRNTFHVQGALMCKESVQLMVVVKQTTMEWLGMTVMTGLCLNWVALKALCCCVVKISEGVQLQPNAFIRNTRGTGATSRLQLMLLWLDKMEKLHLHLDADTIHP